MEEFIIMKWFVQLTLGTKPCARMHKAIPENGASALGSILQVRFIIKRRGRISSVYTILVG